jgi:heptosyltransferase-2
VQVAPKSFLIIQTAFIGDVILATALIEKLASFYPESSIDFLLRKDNESLIANNTHLREVIIWDKKKGKIKNLFSLVFKVRNKKYDYVINAHRFASSGFITAFSGAKFKIGFSKNPLSLFFTSSVPHQLNLNLHEVDRNQKLIEAFTDSKRSLPKLYLSEDTIEKVKNYKKGSYVCVAPTSVWFTKQWLSEKWVELLNMLVGKVDSVYLLGAPADKTVCDQIMAQSVNKHVINLCGQLGFLESAALMKDARMNYVNDSAPMHLASSVNAPVTAIFCSTVPSFGFGPLSQHAFVVETPQTLSCRPCGLHGHKVCPQGHFDCAKTISVAQVVATLV